ncbi:hypothetical protein JW926_03390 [Candidatus Sumerlaeota bacterium]|nr:hypothetical protein [Candidatus Sumerlaeota bacterium]
MSKLQRPKDSNLWKRHVECVLRVISGALIRLHKRCDLPDREEDLDRFLYLDAKIEYSNLSSDKRPSGFNLIQKSENTPSKESDIGEEWTFKRPDFKWRLCNDLANTTDELTMDFDIESKRLGKPTSPNWILNREYVENGISRFILSTHKYGNGVDSGLMIGYIQTMIPMDILKEVNQYITEQSKNNMPSISFREEYFEKNKIAQTSQFIKRRCFPPPCFTLYHLWIDLRSN